DEDWKQRVQDSWNGPAWRQAAADYHSVRASRTSTRTLQRRGPGSRSGRSFPNGECSVDNDIDLITENVVAKGKAQREDRLVISKAADLEMRGVDWLWIDRFALGKFGLIAGMPDMGKGQIAAFISAAVTAGIELPCEEGTTPQGNVIWFNAEDDARDTVLPRLVAAGADPKRGRFVNGAGARGEDRMCSLVTDLQLLRKEIKRFGNVVLVIIDPVSAYLGVGKVDGRSATDVRGVLTPMKDMIEELHVSLIGIAHFNKKDDVKS